MQNTNLLCIAKPIDISKLFHEMQSFISFHQNGGKGSEGFSIFHSLLLIPNQSKITDLAHHLLTRMKIRSGTTLYETNQSLCFTFFQLATKWNDAKISEKSELTKKECKQLITSCNLILSLHDLHR